MIFFFFSLFRLFLCVKYGCAMRRRGLSGEVIRKYSGWRGVRVLFYAFHAVGQWQWHGAAYADEVSRKIICFLAHKYDGTRKLKQPNVALALHLFIFILLFFFSSRCCLWLRNGFTLFGCELYARLWREKISG